MVATLGGECCRMYRLVESPCWTPGTKITLCQLYFRGKKMRTTTTTTKTSLLTLSQLCAKTRRIFIWESSQKYGKYLLLLWWLFSHVRHEISQYNQVIKKLLPSEKLRQSFSLSDGRWCYRKSHHEKQSSMCSHFCLKSQWSSPGFSKLGPLVFCYHDDLSFLGALTFSNTSLGWQTQPPFFWEDGPWGPQD